ncbi:uncharacterized protein LOC141913229 isoform X2 [Tubulanus polymorphus]|uniref:uncharacterized protein LOC141913229 isoform X2 n=1 Tax=Tubulanus polymorphus TaxID=672921 RepID=UPI003DA6C331
MNALFNLLWLCLVEAVTNKCLKDAQFQDRDWNIYWCYEPTVECCHKDNTATCCERKSTTDMNTNLILWGSIFGIVGLVVLIYACYKFENNCCGGDEPWQDRMKNSVCCVCIRRFKHKTFEKLSRNGRCVTPEAGAKRLAEEDIENNGDRHNTISRY